MLSPFDDDKADEIHPLDLEGDQIRAEELREEEWWQWWNSTGQFLPIDETLLKPTL